MAMRFAMGRLAAARALQNDSFWQNEAANAGIDARGALRSPQACRTPEELSPAPAEGGRARETAGTLAECGTQETEPTAQVWLDRRSQGSDAESVGRLSPEQPSTSKRSPEGWVSGRLTGSRPDGQKDYSSSSKKAEGRRLWCH